MLVEPGGGIPNLHVFCLEKFKKKISQVEGDGQVHDKYINQNIILREAQHTPVSHTPGIP